ncbi:MAG: hypothetical protein IT374_08650 [Polyangiaceae bacterium]|nr:hypothetical protein [Polyangiaceae bacterium]
MAETIDPARLLRAVAGAITDEQAPIARLASCRETLDELRAREGDPVAPRLAAWVLWLLLRRANHDAERAAALARDAKSLLVQRDARRVSATDVVTALVSAAPDARELLDALVLGAHRVADPARLALARRGRMLELLGAPRDPGAVVADPTTMAARVLRATDELAREVRAPDLAAAVARAAGHGIDVGWPRALDLPTLLAPLRGEAGWLDVPPMAAPALPRRLAPASFVRGCSRLGERWADACAPRDRPLALAVVPSRLDRHTLGALFASLARSRPLLERLGMSAAERARARRQVALGLLAHTRKLALSVLLSAQAQADGPLAPLFEEHAAAALGAARAPAALALALPRVDPLDGSRLAATLVAASLADGLRERHDEDWLRNPRAVIELRHLLGREPRSAVDDDACEAGLAAWISQTARALG